MLGLEHLSNLRGNEKSFVNLQLSQDSCKYLIFSPQLIPKLLPSFDNESFQFSGILVIQQRLVWFFDET